MKKKLIIKNQKGGALVEFAIVLPLLVLLVFGIIEFGLLLYNQSVITNASREGARAGIKKNIDATTIEAIAVNYCQNRLITFDSTPTPPTAIVNGEQGDPQDPLAVSMTYNYTFLVYQLFGLGKTKTLTAKTIMLME